LGPRLAIAVRTSENYYCVIRRWGGTRNERRRDKVFDPQGRLLFSFTRGTRYTDKGATNAAAKEIIKRLIRWRKEQSQGTAGDK